MSDAFAHCQAHLSAFRPSDREALDGYLAHDATRSIAEEAIRDFIIKWEKADWLEAYSLERIGKWIAKYHLDAVSQGFIRWATENRSEARAAFLKGLEIGASQREMTIA